jgi:hypothetical protein
VPPPDKDGTHGLHCTPRMRDVILRIFLSGGHAPVEYTGLYRYWYIVQYGAEPETTIPVHLQGHIQGGGTERPG